MSACQATVCPFQSALAGRERNGLRYRMNLSQTRIYEKPLSEIQTTGSWLKRRVEGGRVGQIYPFYWDVGRGRVHENVDRAATWERQRCCDRDSRLPWNVPT